MTESPIKKNQAFENLDDKVLELMNDNGMIAFYLASSLVNLSKPENTSQYKLIKDIFLTNRSTPITLYSNMVLFRDTNKSSKLDGNLIKAMTNYNFNVDHSNTQDRRLFYEFGKEMNFSIKQSGRKCPGDEPVLRLPKSPAIMVSGISTIFLQATHNEF